MRILVVCEANLVRSPTAAEALRAWGKREGFTNLQVTSGGVTAVPDVAPPAKLLEAVRTFLLDLSGHRSRLVVRDDLRSSDLVLTMTEGQRQALQVLQPTATPRIFTLKEFIRLTADLPPAADLNGAFDAVVLSAHQARPRSPSPGSAEDVEDAFGGTTARYRACVKEIVKLVDTLSAQLV